ncbi:hypothetical protein ES707_21763 [subsurface metagenome]
MAEIFDSFQREDHVFRSEKFKSVVKEALRFFTNTPVHVLPPTKRFVGGGVYALYYFGDNKLYSVLAERKHYSCDSPIYVGKAVLPGWRTARIRGINSSSLYGRLTEHSRSIRATSGLKLPHFKCRFVIFENIEADLVVPVEAELIRKYKPIWNTIVDGFGNHDPGKGRYNQAKSEWDVLHPGRVWAERCKGTPPEIQNTQEKVKRYFSDLRLS